MNAKSNHKKATVNYRRRLLARGVFLSLPLSLFGAAHAAPQGASIVAGDVNIAQQSMQTTINQHSDKAIINWQSFDIDANEAVQFVQPGAAAIALNRVTNGNPTTILGQLGANGRVFVINPNGVVFGSTAQIDVGGLLATTLDIDNQDFMAGRYEFNQDGAQGFVINQGEIKVADNGFAMLVAPGVSNEGVIVARMGEVGLASGQTMTLDFRGDGLVSYEVSGQVANEIAGPDGQAMDSAVSNAGVIRNPGGTVLLRGDTASNVVSSVVNNSGVIEARSLTQRDGRIVLGGGNTGIVQNTGTLDASAAEAGANGGTILLTGQYAGNFGDIDASSDYADGGNVEVVSTRQTLTSSQSRIDVSGEQYGGTVLLYSAFRSTFDGHVDARGGSGDGGFVDVSGEQAVDVHGHVDATSTGGAIGTFLIDPKNIDVNNAGGAAYAGANNEFNEDPAGATVISATSINSQAADVILQANTDVTVTSAINIANGGTGLTIQAGRSVLVNADITTNDGDITITANDAAAQAANRDAGVGGIGMAAGTQVDAGNAAILLTVDPNGHGDAGGVTLDSVATTGSLTINSVGAILEADADDDVDLRGDTVMLSTTAVDTGMIGTATDGFTDPIEVQVDTRLDIDVADAPIAIFSPGGDLPIGAIDIGTNHTALITVQDGAVLDAGTPAAPNVVANGLTIQTIVTAPDAAEFVDPFNESRAESIGTAADPLRTRVGILAAIAYDDGIFIEEETGILLHDLNAQFVGGTAGSGLNNQITTVVNTFLGPIALDGNTNVVVNAGQDIIVGSVIATDQINLTSGGAILDNNNSDPNATAQGVNLTAATHIGFEADPLEFTTEELTADAQDGGAFFSLNFQTTVNSITTAGADNDVLVQTPLSLLTLGEINAPGGTVVVEAEGGAIVDDNGGAVNVTAARLEISALDGVASAGDPLETDVDEVSATITGEGATFFIDETDGLNVIAASTNNGDTNLNFTGGTFAFDAATSSFTSTGVDDITFENTNGDVALGVVDVSPAGTLDITASGDILNLGSMITADTLRLSTGTDIGAPGDPLNTDVNTLVLEAGTGGATAAAIMSDPPDPSIPPEGSIYVREADAVTVTATTTGATSVVDIANAAGDMTIVKVESGNEVIIDAAGNILVDGNSVIDVEGMTATLSSGGAIGMAGTPLTMRVDSVDAESTGGGLFLSNRTDLDVMRAVATGGDLSVRSDADMILGDVQAAGQMATLSAAGAITDGNAAARNVLADNLTITGRSIGAPDPDAAIDVDLMTLNAATTSGGIYINQLNVAPFNLESAVAIGAGADIRITSAGDVNLGLLQSRGDNVTLETPGAVIDANGDALNADTKNLTIIAPGGIAVGDLLEVDVDQLSTVGEASIFNAGPLAITEESLEGGSSFFFAEQLTILDIVDDLATLLPDTSLVLRTTTGNIVFLDAMDTIEASGTGSITIESGITGGTNAVAIIGNLTTEDQPISVDADWHITAGLFNAGAGDVRIVSARGELLDGNGAALNVIGNNVVLGGRVPTDREAELHTINSLADSHAQQSEEDALFAVREADEAVDIILEDAEQSAITTRETLEQDLEDKTAEVEAQEEVVAPLAITSQVLTNLGFALDTTATTLELAAGVAQALPLSGDLGLEAGAAIAGNASFVNGLALYGVDQALAVEQGELDGLSAEQDNLADNLFAAQQTEMLATSSSDAAAESLSITDAAYNAAVIASDHADRVADQSVIAEDTANAIGSGAQDFGVMATGVVDAAADNSDVFITFDGSAILGNVMATNPDGTARILVNGNNNIAVDGDVEADDLVRIETTAGAITNGGGSVTGMQLLTIATTGVGNPAGLATSVDKFAAAGGDGDVNIINDKTLTIGTIDGVNGVTATGGFDVSLTATGGSILEGDVDPEADITGNTVTLTTTGAAGTIGAADERLEISAVNLGGATGGGSVFLEDVDGGVAINLFDTTGAPGSVFDLLATGGSILDAAAGDTAEDIIAERIVLEVTGAASTVGADGQRLEIDGDFLDVMTAEGSVFLDDRAGGISLGLVTTTPLGGADSTVDILATGGSILDEAVDDTDVDVIAENIALNVTGPASTIGTTAQPVELDADILNGSTEGGDIALTDVGGGVAVGQLTTTGAPGSMLTLRALNGSITEALPLDPGFEFVADTLNLLVTGAGSGIGSTMNPLEMSARNLNTTGTSGRFFLSDPTNRLQNVDHIGDPPSLIIVNNRVLGGSRYHAFKQAHTIFHEFQSLLLLSPDVGYLFPILDELIAYQD